MSMGGAGRAASASGGNNRPTPPLDEAGKQALRDAWDKFMKPYLRG
jgi:hypothetical protein